MCNCLSSVKIVNKVILWVQSVFNMLLRVWVEWTSGKRGFHPLVAAQEPLHSCRLGWLGNNQATSWVLVEQHVYAHGSLDAPCLSPFSLPVHQSQKVISGGWTKRQHILGGGLQHVHCIHTGRVVACRWTWLAWWLISASPQLVYMETLPTYIDLSPLHEWWENHSESSPSKDHIDEIE